MMVPTNITRENNANKINIKQILVKNDYYLAMFSLRINLKNNFTINDNRMLIEDIEMKLRCTDWCSEIIIDGYAIADKNIK